MKHIHANLYMVSCWAHIDEAVSAVARRGKVKPILELLAKRNEVKFPCVVSVDQLTSGNIAVSGFFNISIVAQCMEALKKQDLWAQLYDDPEEANTKREKSKLTRACLIHLRNNYGKEASDDIYAAALGSTLYTAVQIRKGYIDELSTELLTKVAKNLGLNVEEILNAAD